MADDPQHWRMSKFATHITAILLCSISLAGCGENRETGLPAETAASNEQTGSPSAIQDEHLPGREAYMEVCARCHAAGENGAPVTGNPSDWQNRSPLWQAVLMKHAKDGYFRMPAKGGNAEFSDWTVDAATEYMLGITFPDRPLD